MATKNLKMSFIQTLINNKLYPQDTSEYQELLKDLGRMSLKNLKTLMDIVGSQVAEKMRATRATCEAVEKDPEHIAWNVSNMLNNFNAAEPAQKFLDTIAQDHRGIQQCFTRLCVDWLRKLADPDYGSDGRNAASVDLARACKPAIEANPIPNI